MEIKDKIVMETEIIEENIKLRKKKEKISKEVQKKKFKADLRVGNKQDDSMDMEASCSLGKLADYEADYANNKKKQNF